MKTSEVKSGSAYIDPEDTRDPSELDEDELYSRLSDWCKTDVEHANEWREDARVAYDFRAGEQYDDDEKDQLRAKNRPVVVFNRIGPIVDAVIGAEINNRQEIRYLPRTVQDTGSVDVLTSAGRYFRDQSHAEDEESQAFEDAVISGMGWTETRLDFEEDPEGEYVQERVDPFEMVWDASASRSNLVDARRLHRVRTYTLKEAQEMFPDEDPEDLDAKWASGDLTSKSNGGERPRYQHSSGPDDQLPDEVSIVHCQWKESATFYRVTDPNSGQSVDLTEEKLKEKAKTLKMFGVEPKKVKKTVVKQAFLGKKILRVKNEKSGKLEAVRDTLCGRFTWKCITGKRDRNRKMWFGLVKAMIDPQKWANKWMSQTLHILNSQAKGGVFIEEAAVTDINKFRKSYAKADEATTVANGALSNGKIQPKPAAQFPQGHFQLMEFAVSSIRDVTPVNLELMGMADRDQPGILEVTRNKQAITGLAALFDSLRRYRKLQGELMLHMIVDYMSDGRLIRIVGEEGEKYVRLVKQPDVVEFDVIVDDAPTAPNQKEITWALIQQMAPQIQAVMSPDMWATILEYSPAPASFVEKMKEHIQQASQNPPPNPEMIKAQAEQQKMQMQLQMKQQEAQMQAALESQKAERQAQIEGAQAASDIETQRQKTVLEHQHAQAKFEMEMTMKQREHELRMAELQAELQAAQVKHGMEVEKHQLGMQATAAKANAQVETTKAKAKAKSPPESKGPDKNTELMAAILDKLSKPRKIVRDKSGKIASVE